MMQNRSLALRIGLLLVALLVGGALLWLWWEPVTTLLSDWEALQQWVEGLGPWGPVAIIALGILQVLVAPLPGYPIVFVSGALFGGWWGAIYANAGMMIAGMLAAWLARSYGRPLAERFVATTHLKRIEPLLQSDSGWLWFFVLLLPTGDLPYFAAGLSRIPLRRFFVALFWARFPFTFVLTHAAAHAVTLSSEELLRFVVPVAILGLLAYWQQERLTAAFHDLVQRFAPDHTRHEAQE